MRVIIETQTDAENRMVTKMIDIYNRKTPAFIKANGKIQAVHVLQKHKDSSVLVARDTGSDIDIFTVPSSAVVLEDSVNPENADRNRNKYLENTKHPFLLTPDESKKVVNGSIYTIERIPGMPLWYIQEQRGEKVGRSNYISSPAEAYIVLSDIQKSCAFC